MTESFWIELVLVTVGVTAAIIIVALVAVSARWRRETARLVDRLRSASREPPVATFTAVMLEGLPPPVVRYFRNVLREGQPMIRGARLIQKGDFRTGAGWNRLNATQRFSALPPGFVWDACIRLTPLMRVRVRDSYVDGRGTMLGKLLSIITVVDVGDRPELSSGALQRYLAEAVWLPTALLPRKGLSWQAIDERRARATLTDSGHEVSLEFRFNERDEVAEVYSRDRYREVKGHYEPTPWAGRFRDYQVRNGVKIPERGEVEWILPEGPFPYWRARIVDVDYEPGAMSRSAG